jgi:hypothetical protein
VHAETLHQNLYQFQAGENARNAAIDKAFSRTGPQNDPFKGVKIHQTDHMDPTNQTDLDPIARLVLCSQSAIPCARHEASHPRITGLDGSYLAERHLTMVSRYLACRIFVVLEKGPS